MRGGGAARSGKEQVGDSQPTRAHRAAPTLARGAGGRPGAAAVAASAPAPAFVSLPSPVPLSIGGLAWRAPRRAAHAMLPKTAPRFLYTARRQGGMRGPLQGRSEE